MQDKAIASIGRVQLQKLGIDKPNWEVFVENMFPGINYKIVLLIFELKEETDSVFCNFNKIDIESVSEQSNWKKYAYRKGSSSGGDITFTTKFGDIEKKLNTLVNKQLKKIIKIYNSKGFDKEINCLKALLKCFEAYHQKIQNQLREIYNALDKDDKKSTGLSICFEINNERKYLSEFEIIKDCLLLNGTEGKEIKYEVKSSAENQLCSIYQNKQGKILGFAAPFKFSNVDKPGFVSGFFKQKNNWKNYPISEKAATEIEYGKNFINQYLRSYFYGVSYYLVPRTLLKSDDNTISNLLNILRTYTYQIKDRKIKASEDYIEKMISKEEDYFNLDLLFFEENPTTKAISIKLMLEEIVPSRFRTLFVDIPAIINNNILYKDAISIKKEKQDLLFSFRIIKIFFDDTFLDIIQKVFLGNPISKDLLFKNIINIIRTNYNKSQSSDSFVEPLYWTILKAHLLINYFQKLDIISYNKNYNYMENMNEIALSDKKESFNIEKYQNFLKENYNFLDSDIKIGVFSVGILVRLLFNIQQANLGNTPFEKKLRGYNLNSELLKNIYIETLEKISQYQSFYAYNNLRDLINNYFVLKSNFLKELSNSELSFYFVAGLELGNRFKTEK